MNILISKNKEELAEKLAEKIISTAEECIKRSGKFNLVLTGGSSPKRLHEILATKYLNSIDWNKVFFFFGDERYVRADHKDYNGGMANATLLHPLGIPDENIFFVNTNLSPEVAAADYYDRIKAHFSKGSIIFDLVLLGMGDDAHTASLFPGTTILESAVANVEAVFVEKLDSWRISMTAKLINNAKEVIFLVFGEGKAAALKAVLSGDENIKKYPSRAIKGNVSWYVDEAAAAGSIKL